MKKFKVEYPNLKESSVRVFRDKYNMKIKTKGQSLSPAKKIVSKKRGRPCMLGDLDEKIKSFLMAVRKKGGVVNTVVTNAAANALIEKSGEERLQGMDLTKYSWAKSLFRRMGFVKRAATTARPEITEGARKEAELIFHHEIVSKIEKHKIPHSMVINIDQTPSKHAPVSSRTLAPRNAKHVSIFGSSDKRAITATFGITLDNSFLPMQLIYGGKTNQSLPKFKFPSSFSLSVNEKHFSNTNESITLIEDVIVPYVVSQRKSLGLDENQYALLILDVFSGQMTEQVKEKLKESHILFVRVPANMTNLFQPLDLTVNRSFKAMMKRKFTEWYSKRISEELDKGTPLEEIDIKLKLSVLKPLHAKWLVDAFNFFTSPEGKDIISKGWQQAGITNAVAKGINGLESLDPFDSIDPLADLQEPVDHSDRVLDPNEQSYFINDRQEIEDDNESDEEWVEEEIGEEMRNIFDVLEEEEEEF